MQPLFIETVSEFVKIYFLIHRKCYLFENMNDITITFWKTLIRIKRQLKWH